MLAKNWPWAVDLLLALLLAILFACLDWGRVQTVEYDSTTLGVKHRMLVYLPPGYTGEKRYPVLYLLHGAGDDAEAWIKHGSANVILDNLHARGQIVPMIVVMPSGLVPGHLVKPIEGAGPSTAFEDDLLNDVVPFVDAKYSTIPDSEHRAIAGVSMGGGQALCIGIAHVDDFAWVGGFAPSFGNREPPLPEAHPTSRERLRSLWLSCGDSDQLFELNQYYHGLLEDRGLPHVWHVGSGEHEWSVWRDDLARFVQLLFRPEPHLSSP